jgi:hypothetical protein
MKLLHELFIDDCLLTRKIIGIQNKVIFELQTFDLNIHHIFIKPIPKSNILYPTHRMTENYFKFEKPFKLNVKSRSNNPNEFNDERFYIKEWWNKGMNRKEINDRLLVKREKYFS